MPALSVIVPVYKAEKYLNRCVDSILSQTFDDLELILVDDGSPDRCGAICDEYAEKDSRVIVIHKENGGQASAKNMALDIFKGDYVGFVDSDDWIHPQMYEIMIGLLQSQCSDIVQCNFMCTNESEVEFDKLSIEDIESNITVFNRDDFINNFYKVGHSITDLMCDKLFKREIFNNIRLPQGQKFEDSYLKTSFLDCASKVITTDKVFYIYFQSDNSTMRSDYAFWKAKDRNLLFSHRVEFFREKNLKEQELCALDEYFLKICQDKCKIWVDNPELKKEFKSVQKIFNKEAKKIFFSPLMCNMKRLMMICLYVSPKTAYKIAKKYFPECLYEEMR